MGHGLRSDQAPRWWLFTSQWLEWLALGTGAAIHWIGQLRRRANRPPEQWMSREWLDEFERRSIKRPGDFHG
jgi:hypothetical protein